MAILFSLSHHNDFNKKNGEKMVIVLSQTDRTVDVNEVAKYAVSHYAPEMHYTQLAKSIDILNRQSSTCSRTVIVFRSAT